MKAQVAKHHDDDGKPLKAWDHEEHKEYTMCSVVIRKVFEKESPEHLWHECLRIGPEARKITNQRPTRLKHSWSPTQVDRFLRDPIIVNLFDQETE